MALGYCPAEAMNGAVSHTLEYSADDFCLARMAEHLGKADLAAELDARALGWKHHWDPESGFLAPRNGDGTVPSFSEDQLSDFYVEGSAWQYLFMVPHHAQQLVTQLGGPETFVERLETFMGLGAEAYDPLLPNAWYYHGNEPDLIAPWLFGFAGRKDRTRYWIEWIADTIYHLKPGGLIGNEDGGTLSAWWVYAGAGLYPLPCTGQYALSAPLFDRVVWTLPGGELEIRRSDGPGTRWNGTPFEGPTIAVDTLVGGGLLELESGNL